MKKYQATATLEILQDAKNYNTWIAETFIPFLEAPVLEIGAGIGNLTKYFYHKTPFYISDVDQSLLFQAEKKLQKKSDVFLKKYDLMGKPPKKFLSHFSSVIGINVLEHIEDDEQALRNIALTLKSEGKLLLLVPAKKFAYTRFDRNIGHFRRYEKRELINKLEATGYIIEKIFFFNIIGLFSWIVRDKVERNNIQMKSYQIVLFDSIVPFLRKLEGIVKPPMGVSLIVIARKVSK